MHNHFLPARTAQDIDKHVAKILRELGDPYPPLRLELVRELLRLDLGFYSSADHGIIAESGHRLVVSGKQIYARPSLVWDAIKKLDLKALWIPDRKRILLDKELPDLKKRWGEAHEIGHSIIPWHDSVMHGDVKQTLSLTCEQQVEAEANYAAGRLLFLQDQFLEQLFDSPLSFDGVKKLSKVFGNTMTSTLWRAVESSPNISFALVSGHPKEPVGDDPVRYYVRSRSFSTQFSGVSGMQVYRSLQRFCRRGRGPIGKDLVHFRDSSTVDHEFLVECFFNGHETLTFGVYQHVRVAAVSVM